VVEVHDCFTVTELLMLEALGLCPRGEAAALVRDGATEIGGRVPVNPGGGLIGFGHPVGATGVKQPLEVFRQMKGRCGEYQVGRDLRWGFSANMGGDDRTAVCLAIRNGA
jgi:acetyl-CoA acyltransferase